MLEHHRDVRPYLRSDICPLRSLTEGEGLGGLSSEWGGEEGHGVDVCIKHYLIFFPSQIAEFQTPLNTRLAIACCCLKEG